MSNLTDVMMALLPSMGAVIGVYVNLQTEITKVKSRIHSIENDHSELKEMVKECIEGIHELKILLARRGL